jgi:hypothetical protein
MVRSMKQAILMVIGLIAAALAALAGGGLWFLTPNKYEWNQRITVEVETPDGMKSGSSVQHILWEGGGPAYPGQDGPSSSSKVTGEAVVVDLGGGKYLFALLSGTKGLKGAADTLASFALWGADKAAGTTEGLKFLSSLPAGTKAVLEPDNYPLLVTFSNTNDPSTVTRVDPSDMPEIFGDGVNLSAIVLVITADDVTKSDLRTMLPWLGDFPEPPLAKSPDLFNPTFTSRVHHGDFKRLGQ